MGAKPKELRDYDEAILRACGDGLVHSREELMKAGCAAIDPHYALSMYQKANGSHAEERFEGLNAEERLAEIEHQRYEGAKLQVGKRLSHLEDGGLLEVAEWGEPRPGRIRKRRISYRISDRGLARLAGASDEQIDATWEKEARELVLHMAQTIASFTTEDAWRQGLRRPLTQMHNPLQSVFLWAQRQSFIEITDDKAKPLSKSGGDLVVYRSLIHDQQEISWLTCDICDVNVDPLEVGTSKIVICNQEVTAGRMEGARPFAPEATGAHVCKDCTQAIKNAYQRGRKNLRQNLRDSRATRV